MSLSDEEDVLEISDLIKERLFYEAYNIDCNIYQLILVIVSLSKDHKTHSIG
jgi:hypothetical protein